MLRIKKISAGRGEYYLALSQGDYYLEGGPRPGYWLGQGAKALGLRGDVEPDQFRNLLSGYDPRGGPGLRQNAGTGLAGWDLMLAAPKSVDVLYSQATPLTQTAILECHRAAVAGTAFAIEAAVGISRRGKGGASKESATVVLAAFEHYTSRSDDPLIHTHLVLPNVGVRPDGTTGALHPSALYARQREHFGDRVYKSLLASQLEDRLGLRLHRSGYDFEVADVPKTLCDAFSKRRKDVLKFMGEHELQGDRGAEFAALATRSAKSHRALSQLVPQWRRLGQEHQWSTAEAEALVARHEISAELISDLSAASDAVSAARKRLDKEVEKAEANFGRSGWFWRLLPPGPDPFNQTAALLNYALDEGRRRGVAPEAVSAAFAHHVREELSGERTEAIRVARERIHSPSPQSPAASLLANLPPSAASLTKRERAIVETLCSAPRDLTLVAVDDASRASSLKVSAQILEQAGYRVRAARSARKDSERFQTESGIPTATLAKTLAHAERWLERETPAPLLERAVALGRYATGRIPRQQYEETVGHIRPSPPKLLTVAGEALGTISHRERLYHDRNREREQYRLDSKTVLLALDAEKLTPHDVLRLLDVTDRSGAKLVLVGGQGRGPALDGTHCVFDALRLLEGPKTLEQTVTQTLETR